MNNITFTIEFIPAEEKARIFINTRQNNIEYDEVTSVRELPEVLEQYIKFDMWKGDENK